MDNIELEKKEFIDYIKNRLFEEVKEYLNSENEAKKSKNEAIDKIVKEISRKNDI